MERPPRERTGSLTEDHPRPSTGFLVARGDWPYRELHGGGGRLMTTRTGAKATVCAVVFASTLLAVRPAMGQAAASGNGQRASFTLGEDVFFHETFGGNGRTCATCHDPRNEFTVSPELVQQRYQIDPGHPLFRPIDSDDGRGNSYATLRDHAWFPVTIPLHPNF